jgi:hypothetical protein
MTIFQGPIYLSHLKIQVLVNANARKDHKEEVGRTSDPHIKANAQAHKEEQELLCFQESEDWFLFKKKPYAVRESPYTSSQMKLGLNGDVDQPPFLRLDHPT